MKKYNEEKLQNILSFIEDYKSKYKASPSIREISNGTGISKSSVSLYMAEMQSRGILSFDKARSIVTALETETSIKTRRVPLLGVVSCGIPKYAEENIDEYIILPDFLTGSGDFFMLHAKGDSMINAGIDDGDILLVKQQTEANNGDIVVALINNEATLKRYFEKHDHTNIELVPENPEYQSITVDLLRDDFMIQGVVRKIIKTAK